MNQSLFTTKSDQWNTPAHIVDVVREVFGGRISLDPCTSVDNPTDALDFYTDGGLEKQWWGDVYVNPPYGRQIGKWVRKAAGSYDAGLCSRVICLLPARTDTVWFRVVNCYPVLFIRGRLKFGGAKSGAPFPSALIFMGFNESAEIKDLRFLGQVYLPQRDWKSEG
jgi:phage N-6-adenine-methyltransferase